MIIAYRGITPQIAETAYVSPTAVIEGDVRIADGASIWHGAVLRGDMAPIRVGRNSNIQDNCTVHVDVHRPAVIGEHVTVGHNAVIHGCAIDDLALIGIGAVVLTGARVGTGCVIAAGSVVTENAVIAPYCLAAGVPATVKRRLSEEQKRKTHGPSRVYMELSADRLNPKGSRKN
jgi:carbonic anhydrase/acetyltransferase-like protein (isoleucine patch superfamily)